MLFEDKFVGFTYYNNAWILKSGFLTSRPITKDQSKKLLHNGGMYVRNIFNWDRSDKKTYWYIIKDEFGGFEELPTKVRNQVKKSLKTYDFRIVSYDEMLNIGCALYNKSRARFKNTDELSPKQWRDRLNRDKNNEYWIGFDRESGMPASFALNAIYDDYVDYCTMGINPDFPNNTYPMYGLIFEMNRYYLDVQKVAFVCDGARSMTGHSNIQQVLEDKFKFRKAYCEVQVFYRSWLELAVKLLFPFRSLIRPPKISAILRQEAWVRGLDK